MNVIKQSNNRIIEWLGGPQMRSNGVKYRFNKYCIFKELDGWTLIHNCITGSTVGIRPVELMNIHTQDPCDYVNFLVNNYFLVQEDFDEQFVVDFLRDRTRTPIVSGYLNHPSAFTILSTTRCNARCFYCYQQESKHKQHMTNETAEKIAHYIISVAPRDKQIHLSWFGGEPLFNPDVIDIITSRVASAGFKFNGSMVTNGYLFDSKMLDRAKGQWNINNVQITLDGTQEVYNKSKNYIYKGIDAYSVVLDNIEGLLDNQISVSVRMNLDEYNSENLLQLVRELHDRFGKSPYFSMYAWPIFDENNSRTEEQNEKVYGAMLEIDKLLNELGYSLSHGLESGIKGRHCMVDGGEGVVIMPDGHLGVCEHYIDSGFIGHIDNPTDINLDILKSWRKYSKYEEWCKDCPIYPECIKMEKCTDMFICGQAQHKYQIEHAKLALWSDWKTYVKNKDNESKQCSDKTKCSNKTCPEKRQ